MSVTTQMRGPAVLVTGAAGFIGRAVCARLAARGTPLLATDCVSDDPARTVTVCDLADIHRLYAITEGRDIAGIIHCGAVSGPMLARDNPRALIETNVVGTANVLELARVRGVSRFVLASSAAVFGQTPSGPVPEAVLARPTTVYGGCKLAAESLVGAYAIQCGLDAVSLRLCWVYGPARRTSCVIRTMLEDMQRNRPTRFPYGQDFPRQFVYIEDAAAALVAAFDRPHLPQPVYTITGGEYLTLGELGHMVTELFPHADIQLDAGPAPEDDVQHVFDISAAARDLGYRPWVGLREGVRRYAAWLARQSAHESVPA
jgi:nucleoside-diphosphate-sugar epimerase